MQKIYFFILFLSVALLSTGQNKNGDEKEKTNELNCYNKWAAKFDERGGDEVADGIYDDVIISIRKGANADCYSGKAEVKDKIVVSLFIQREDGSYEELKWQWKNEGKQVTVANGISSAFIYKDNTLVNVIWPKKLKAKKAPFKKAPEPVDD